jgi:hypothetical protein
LRIHEILVGIQILLLSSVTFKMETKSFIAFTFEGKVHLHHFQR